MQKSGVYQIKNLINNKCYIGSSIDIENRWKRHKKDLRNKKHHSIILQRAWDKYSENNFEFSIIEECPIEILIIQEQYYLELYEPVYNICRIAGSCLGIMHSKESNEKKRKYALDNNIKPPVPEIKKVFMLNYNTLKVEQEFSSLTLACAYLGKDINFVSTISSCCNNKRYSAFGYRWVFNLEDIQQLRQKKNLNERHQSKKGTTTNRKMV